MCIRKIKEYENRSSLIKSKLDEYFQSFIKESDSHSIPLNNNLTSQITEERYPIYDNQIDQETFYDDCSEFFSDTFQNDLENSNLTDLEMAVIISNQAKEEDKNHQFHKAITLYNKSIELFTIVIEEEENKIVRDHMIKMVNAFTQRVEAIMNHLNNVNQFIPESSPQESQNEILNAYEGVDIRIGLLQKNKSKTFWSDKNPLFMSVNIDKNIVKKNSEIKIHIKLTNLARVRVENIGIHIKMTETITLPNDKGVMKTETKESKLNRMVYKKKGVFPLSRGMYEGEIRYPIPDIPITEADFSTSYAREHFLIVQCRILYHNDLSLEFPFRLIS